MFPLPPPPQMEINLPGKENMSTPLNPEAKKPRSMWMGTPRVIFRRSKTSQIILQQPRKTPSVVWCEAILCLVFRLLLIVFAIATLIIYLVVKPRTPLFDIPNASLSTIYFDSPEYSNGNFNFVANFTNPNKKIDLQFVHAEVDLYFFHQRKSEVRLQPVQLISNLILLPQNIAVKLQNQVQRNRIMYNIRGNFKVRAKLGLVHYSYWVHGKCDLELTGPPYGILFARRCTAIR